MIFKIHTSMVDICLAVYQKNTGIQLHTV